MAATPPTGENEPRRRGPSERRHNVALRELLDELIELSRHLSHHARTMSAIDLEYARGRMEWLADEIWDQVTRTGDS
jgi:hypothetical protein